MQQRTVHVRAPARLHFGLFSFGNRGRQYGGVGVMVQQPAVQVEIRAADRFAAAGEGAELLQQVARRWARARRVNLLPPCRLAVVSAPPRHAGFGSGTQLALAAAAGLDAWARLDPAGAPELAQLAGRGRRSAIGTFGFLHGGLIIETGKLPSELLGQLDRRLAFPEAWRFVLLRLGRSEGLHGAEERGAFDRLAPVSSRTRQELIREVHANMIPALMRGDCHEFGESLYRFGVQAGACFAGVQGGPFRDPQTAALVQEIRQLGVSGVGQSSWGPTLFCVLPDQLAAETLARELRRRHGGENLEACVTAADNQGARVTVA